MTEVPSAELLARYRQHDAAAAEALFQRYVERLTQLAPSRLSRKLAARVDAEVRLEGQEVEAIATPVQRSARTVRRTLTRLGAELERRLKETALPPAVPVFNAGSMTLLSYSDIVLQQQLGEGGMGKVYRALRRSTNTQVAVKLLRKPLRQHETATA